MSKIGRPTTDPCKQYSIIFPLSISKDLEPRGMESRSKRVSYLVKLGIQQEKRKFKRK